MNRYGIDVRLTAQARQLLRPDEALVLDWHRIAICCAGAGEMSLYAMREDKARGRKGLVRLKGEDPIYAARAIFPHLAGSEVIVDARRTLGVRRFTSNLPGDFGLRAIMGRLPEPDKAAPSYVEESTNWSSKIWIPTLLIPVELPSTPPLKGWVNKE